MQRLAFSLSVWVFSTNICSSVHFFRISFFQKRKFAALIVDPQAQTEAYERISGLCLQPRVLALTGMRVVAQDFGRKLKLKFWS